MANLSQNTVRLPILTCIVKDIFFGTNNYHKRYIMTTCKKLEKVLEHLEKNPFFERYANKIAKLQQTKPNEFLQRVENQEKLQKAKEKWEEEQKFYESQAKPCLGQNQQPQQAQLNDIMKMDMVQNKTKDELINIWKDYHKDKNYICGILTPDQFDKMFENGKRYPTFLLPLPRKQGYEFIVSQFYGLEIHMTPLLWYQAHKENAPECLTMVHYTEFRDNKEIILMRGEYDEKCINGQEAQCLVNELQLYYCANDAKRLQLLETFTNKPEKFKYMDLVAQLEAIQLIYWAFYLSRPYRIQTLWTYPFLMIRTQPSWISIKKRNFSDHAVKNMYITTPIFYVNAGPHIGHLYTAVLADAIARFNAMLGHSVFLCTGTDEHGTKVQKAANSMNLSLPEYCTEVSHEFKKMCNIFHIGYSKFIRTTEVEHRKAVHHFWNSLEKNGHIYQGKYSGWYDVTEEAFVSGKEIQEKNPTDINYTSTESGNKLEWMDEDNYKFRLTSFKDNLKYWLKDENVIEPKIYHKMLIPWLEDLQDLSISRPINRVSWAIPTPSDESHTIYVWLDALVNYLTSLGYPDNSFREFWPPTVQVIGKDILKFHSIYWPAFLMAAGLEPPKKLVCHGHWAIKDKKMSKSERNVISPFTAMHNFTDDGLRYFLLRQAVLHSDANYNDLKVQKVLNSELSDTLGNLVNRCFSKAINPDGIIYNSAEYKSILKTDVAQENIKALEELSEKAKKYYEKYNFYHMVDTVMHMLHIANKMFSCYEPWHLKKSEALDSVKQFEALMSLTMENLRVAALVLYPIIPKSTSNLLDHFQVPMKNRTWEDTKPLHLTNNSNEAKHVSSRNMLFFSKIKNQRKGTI